MSEIGTKLLSVPFYRHFAISMYFIKGKKIKIKEPLSLTLFVYPEHRTLRLFCKPFFLWSCGDFRYLVKAITILIMCL